MKALKYAVSIQWGEGFHYFSYYSNSIEEASRVAHETSVRLKSQQANKRGAKPKVFLWEMKGGPLK